MESIRTLFKIGMGPSSSHTMGPRKAALDFKAENKKADSYRVTLYGSLAATGKGHLTDKAIIDALAPQKVEIIWKSEVFLPFHPNGMFFEALDNFGNPLSARNLYSVGGGEIVDDSGVSEKKYIYEHALLDDIIRHCRKYDLLLHDYVEYVEGPEIWDYLKKIWTAMRDAVKRGSEEEGRLPGMLNLARKARYFMQKAKQLPDVTKKISILSAYALACSEENAAGGIVVTAPTCGSSGVLPAALKSWYSLKNYSQKDILKALAVAGLIGNLARTNASISGAEVGCQGEIGVACAMAAAASASLLEPASLDSIEYAAEMGIEHHLGLTCDPIGGLVQIPCIERNAMAAMRAVQCAAYAVASDGRHRVTFDEVITVMKQTGLALNSAYKETSQAGLAKEVEILSL